MAVGFRVKNSSSLIQIDETYRNLALRAKGSFSPSTVWSTTWRIGSITVSGSSPVLAWRSSAPAAIVGASRSGSSITYTFMIAATSGTISWWLFDEPIYGAVTGSVGLRIRNPSTGVITFDSRMKYMRVIGAITGEYVGNNPPASAQYSGLPALVAGNIPYRYVSNVISQAGTPPYPWVDFVIYPMVAMSGQQLTWSNQQSLGVDHPPSQTFVNPSMQDSYNYLVIDVDNL